MSNNDREAFEAQYDKKYTPGYAYPASHRLHAWEDWQAARDHFAPKLTEAEAVKAAAAAIYAVNPDCYWGTSTEHERLFAVSLEMARADIRDECNKMAQAALRAAGVRFKEEAPSNPEPGSCQ